MKKFCLCIIFIILIISCNPDARKDNQGYLVESNITAIGGNGRAIAGDEIVGVLLRYDYTDESVFFLEFNENGELKQNGDGMKYNYVLYIPPYIRIVYEKAGGRNPDSGNPFWWYMSRFFNLSKDDITQDYEKALALLLSKKGEYLPVPKTEDVSPSWVTGGFGEDDVSSVDISTVDSTSLSLIRLDGKTDPIEENVDGCPLSCQSKGPFAQKAGDEYDAVITNAFYIGEYNHLYYPTVLCDEYAKFRHYTTSGSPFWIYLETYFDFPQNAYAKDDFDFTDVLNALIEAQTLPLPDVADYERTVAERPVVPIEEILDGYQGFFDKEGEIKLENDDGFVFPSGDSDSYKKFDSQRDRAEYKDNPTLEAWLTFSVVEENNGELRLYYPVVLEYVCKQYRQSYVGGSGDPLWDYVNCYFDITLDEVKEKGMQVVLDALEKEMDEKGFLPFPSLEDYRNPEFFLK